MSCNLKPVLALLLGVMTLLSASRFSIGTHLCSGKLQHLSFLGSAERCKGETNLPPCHRTTTKSCCEDHLVVHSGEELATPETPPDLTWTAPALVPIVFSSPVPVLTHRTPVAPGYPPPPDRIFLRVRSLLI